MFTGLIEEVGRIERLSRRGEGAHIHIAAEKVLEGIEIGDSVAVNGACLTITDVGGGSLVADCMGETLVRTNLGGLAPGHLVNLERALAIGDRMGGHMVLGHVDAVATVLEVRQDQVSKDILLSLPVELQGLVAEKGSIAIDGISLTVTYVDGQKVGVGVIPHTARVTTLRNAAPGTQVNLEADVIARYVRSAMGGVPAGSGRVGMREGSGVDEDLLKGHGFLE